ncbi:unnamed protein product, partial [Callosobruchus maculatus]
MSAAGTPSADPWVIVPRERLKYEEHFKSLKPNNGIITGEQAKGFFLQSSLPPLILGQIWALADTDSDGKMNIDEFSIACKLINLKLRGYEIPALLPPSLLASLKGLTPLQGGTGTPTGQIGVQGSLPPSRPEPPKVGPVLPATAPLIPGLSGIVPPIMQATSVPTVAPLTAQISSVSAPITTQPLPCVAPLISSAAASEGIPPLAAAAGIPSSKVMPLSGTTIGSLGALPTLTSTLPTMATSGPTALPSVGLGIDPVSLVTPAVVAPPVGTVAPLSSTMIPTLQSAGLTSSVTASGLPSSTGLVPTAPISIPSATSTPRASIGSLDRSQSIESQPEWSVPHQTKLKYTQLFNSTDRQRSGYLSGAQARNIMVQTKLPQNVLAEIWALSDMDADGRLGCEEFVLAMHLCERAQAGTPPPARLPPDLIPPAFRRAARTSSISSQGSAGTGAEQDPAATLLQQNSFEDKRKENFEKGQAELERRRRALYDQQRQEREERERKEREEQERKEKARQEVERKRLEELEKQMREQQEKERLLEEERKRQAEQRETARREMERQRQLEWEKQRLQELQQQRQREQENVLKLKAKNQTLTIELTSLNEQIKQLSQKICDTRIGVTNAKSTIDGMRGTRDGYMSEMSQLKNKLKEQNAKLLALSQEKV